MRVLHLDYETRSVADLPSVGSFRYGIDPSTEILMCGVSMDDSDEVLLWVNPKYGDSPDNGKAELLLQTADLYFCHNAPFELATTWGTHERGAVSPFVKPPEIHQWRCTAAMARKAGLPSSLEKVAEALGLSQQKDTRGKKLIKLFSEPQRDGKFVSPSDKPDEWAAFCEYCRQDVRTEKAVHKKLKPFELQGASLDTFLFDLRMNLRGIPVNVPALENARKVILEVQEKVTKEFVALTGLNPTQREEVRKIVGLENMQAETVEAAIDLLRISVNASGEQTPPEARRKLRILELYQKLSFAAVKKVHTMLDCACPDGRVRGSHLYYGTGPGRWAGRLIQPQNFKKTPIWMRPITGDVYSAICKGYDADALDFLYGNPVELISGCIRHFIHQPGTNLFDADYSAIQARGICWLAGEDKILAMWRDGRDLYKYMASQVYAKPESQINDDGRSFGKVIELACGFQMGASKFKATCEAWGVPCDDALAVRGVDVYRSTHPKVVRYWYFLNESARDAIARPGTRCGPFLVRTIAGIPFLLALLPSGRSLAYPYPKVEVLPGEERDQITYWGQDPYSTQWTRIKLYGGKLAENITMAVEADIMAHGLVTAEKRGYDTVAVVHDQALALAKEGQTIDGFVAALADLPPWAAGFPIKSDGRVRPYYTK